MIWIQVLVPILLMVILLAGKVRLEAVLPARVKEPVDRPLLVGLAVILVEVVEEVAADVLERAALAAERVRD